MFDKMEIGEIVYVLQRKTYRAHGCKDYKGYGLFFQNNGVIQTLTYPTTKIQDLALEIRKNWKGSMNIPSRTKGDLCDFRFKLPEDFPEFTVNGGNHYRFIELSEDEMEEFAKYMTVTIETKISTEEFAK